VPFELHKSFEDIDMTLAKWHGIYRILRDWHFSAARKGQGISDSANIVFTEVNPVTGYLRLILVTYCPNKSFTFVCVLLAIKS